MRYADAGVDITTADEAKRRIGAMARRTFGRSVLAPIGGSRAMDFGEVVGYGVDGQPEFWLGPWQTGEGFRESHVAFTAPDRASVRAFFDAAVATGSCAPTIAPSRSAKAADTGGRSCMANLSSRNL